MEEIGDKGRGNARLENRGNFKIFRFCRNCGYVWGERWV